MPGISAAARSLQLTMVIVGAISFIALVADIAPTLAGGRPIVTWLAWIPMIGLPIAFLAFAGLLVGAIKRRKAL